MKENKKKIIYLILFIAVTITTVGIATYAYFSSSVSAGANVPFNVATANGTIFTASSEGDIEFDIGFEEMSEANVSTNIIATDNAIITVKLDSENEKEVTTCTYDLVWVWDSVDKYTEADVELPYTKDSVTYPYELTAKVDSKDEKDLSTFSWKEVATKYEAVIASKEISVAGKGSTTNTHQVDVSVYNIPVDQQNLFNKEFRAHIEVKNNNCTTSDNSPSINVTPSYKGAEAVPLTTGALANLECTGANATYNQKYNQVEISSLTADKTNCTLTYTDRTNTTLLTDKVKSLVGGGQVYNEKGYRYEGKEVDNYVWFNNELWRIIGIFGQDRHGQAGLELTKIIRTDSIGGLVWDKNNQNNWVEASLNKLLNGAYLSRQNGTNGEYCYGYSTSAKVDCDYTESGIATEYRNMIKEVVWYLGATDTAKTAEEMYTLEMGTTGSATAPDVVSTNAKIGLMYASDYGYAAPSTNCARTTALSSYDCTGYNWLYGQGYEWTMVPRSSNANGVFYVDYNGSVGYSYANNGCAVRPVLYLDSLVYVMGGTGTKADPYIIGMN